MFVAKHCSFHSVVVLSDTVSNNEGCLIRPTLQRVGDSLREATVFGLPVTNRLVFQVILPVSKLTETPILDQHKYVVKKH